MKLLTYLVTAAAVVTLPWNGAGAGAPKRFQSVGLPTASSSPGGPHENGRTVQASPPAIWPALVKPRSGAPNVLLIMTDDVGFGAASTFGGPVPTSALDRLARAGLRYNRFHTTAMCSPSRASLLTGRNHTRVGMGAVTDRATGYDGYTTIIPKSAGTIAEILRQSGYSTAAFGKWHLVPSWETGPNGPYDHWPIRMGFDHFLGFLTGDTDQWAPALYRDLAPIEPPANDDNWLLDRALADDAIHWIQEQKSVAPEKPFFAYFAPGTAHAPHHAPAEWLARFRGKFDQGWDKVREETFARQKAQGVIPANAQLTRRPPEIPAWSSLSAAQKKVYAREMEAFAAALSYADHQVDRVLDALRDMGQLDNTLVIYIQGDNGGSGEGGLTGAFNESSILNGLTEDIGTTLGKLDQIGSRMAHSNYPAGWGWASNAPFLWMKVIASHFGGSRNGLVISWPNGIKPDPRIRSQFHHLVDIAPTILEAAGVAEPATLNGTPQMSWDGIPMTYTFADPAARDRRHTQFFTIYDNMGIYHDGWVAGTIPEVFPWDLTSTAPGKVEGRRWQLFNVDKDFTQSDDLASSNPAKLRELQDLFWAEAKINNAYPVHRGEGGEGKPSWVAERDSFLFYPGTSRLPAASAPATINRSFEVEAETVIASADANGMLVTQGGRPGGWGFYLLNGRLMFHYNRAGLERFQIVSKGPLTLGSHRLRAIFNYDGGGAGKGAAVTLYEDDAKIGEGRIERTLPRLYALDAAFDVGLDTGSPVSEDYSVPFIFPGLKTVRVKNFKK